MTVISLIRLMGGDESSLVGSPVMLLASKNGHNLIMKFR